MKTRFRHEIWSLLKRNLSAGQLLGYALANVVGLTVILAGILFYGDSQESTAQDDQYFSEDYVVLSKKVEGVGFTPVVFSDDDIQQLSQQKWVQKIGRFTASQFAVNGSINMGGRSLSTYLFLESVPDEFFDVKPRGWHFDPAEKFIPIMLSKDYLALYNFGFALPQGLPQISEKMIGAMPFVLGITGKDNNTEFYEAAIVGFSSRLNTIAVPQSFMDWANSRYAVGEVPPPSRLIVKIDQLAAAGMEEYCDQEGIEIAGDNKTSGNISKFLGLVSSVVASNGVVITLLALFILILSIYLLLQKNRETIRKLMGLGFHPREISRYYEIIVLAANSLITLLAVVLTISFRQLWHEQMQDLGLGGASLLPMLSIALAYLLIVTAFNIHIIRRNIRKIWAE